MRAPRTRGPSAGRQTYLACLRWGSGGGRGAVRVRAYVLVKVITGSEREALPAFEGLQELREIDFIFGEYDYILTIEAENVDALTELVKERIRKAPGVAKTATLIAANL